MPAVTATRAASTAAGAQIERKDSGATPGRSDFLRLLTEQLRHQDPLNPMEDKDMMSQLAQFSALEETQSMRQSLDKLALGNQVSQGAALIGKTVTGTLPAGFDAMGNPAPGRTISGPVSGVTLRGGETLLSVGNETLALSSITRVETT